MSSLTDHVACRGGLIAFLGVIRQSGEIDSCRFAGTHCHFLLTEDVFSQGSTPCGPGDFHLVIIGFLRFECGRLEDANCPGLAHLLILKPDRRALRHFYFDERLESCSTFLPPSLSAYPAGRRQVNQEGCAEDLL